MDTSDFEDMLFGDFDKQITPDDALSEDSDEELLFTTSREEAMLWGMSNSSDSTLRAAGSALHSQEEHQCYRPVLNERPIRDRCFMVLKLSWLELTFVQILGDRSH